MEANGADLKALSCHNPSDWWFGLQSMVGHVFRDQQCGIRLKQKTSAESIESLYGAKGRYISSVNCAGDWKANTVIGVGDAAAAKQTVSPLFSFNAKASIRMVKIK